MPHRRWYDCDSSLSVLSVFLPAVVTFRHLLTRLCVSVQSTSIRQLACLVLAFDQSSVKTWKNPSSNWCVVVVDCDSSYWVSCLVFRCGCARPFDTYWRGCVFVYSLLRQSPQWGTADAEIKSVSVGRRIDISDFNAQSTTEVIMIRSERIGQMK